MKIDQNDITGTFSDELYKSNPRAFRKAIAVRLLWLLLPTFLSDRLPKWMSQPVILYWIIIDPDDDFVEGVTLPPGFVVPDYVVPEDRYIDGAAYPPGAIKNVFLKAQRPVDGQETTQRKSVIVNPDDIVNLGQPGTRLKPGTQIRPVLQIVRTGGPLPADTLPPGRMEVIFGDVVLKVPPKNDIPLYMGPSGPSTQPDGTPTRDDVIKYIKDTYIESRVDKIKVEWFLDKTRKEGGAPPVFDEIELYAEATYEYHTLQSEDWYAERSQVEASTIYAEYDTGYFGFATNVQLLGYSIVRTCYKFNAAALPPGKTVKTAFMILKAVAGNQPICVQKSDTTNMLDASTLSSMQGNPSEPGVQDDDNWVIMELGDTLINHINANIGEDFYVMTRNYNFDYLNNPPPLDEWGSIRGRFALWGDPTEIPMILCGY